MGSGRSRYAALKERKARLARSKSSALVPAGNDDEDDDGEAFLTPFTSRFGGELARSRSSHMLKDQRPSDPGGGRPPDRPPDNGGTSTGDDNLSSWAKYLKNKYGGRAATASGAQDPPDREQEKEDRRASPDFLLGLEVLR